MNLTNIQYNYESYILSAIPQTSTGEIAIELSKEHPGDMGFLVLEPGVVGQEDRIFYHRKNANTVYTYHTNRSNPVSHPKNSQVMSGAIGYINYLLENVFEQNAIHQIDQSNFSINGGAFYIDGIQMNLAELNTGSTIDPDQELIFDTLNYLYVVEDNGNYKYIITDVENLNHIEIARIEVDSNGGLQSITPTKTLPIGSGLSDAMIAKINSFDETANKNVQSNWNQTDPSADDFIKSKPTIPAAQVQSDWGQMNALAINFIKNKPDLSVYQLVSNILTTIRATNNASDTKYVSEKAIALALDTKVDKVSGKDLSDNNFEDKYKTQLDEITLAGPIDKYLPGSGVKFVPNPNDPNLITVESFVTGSLALQACQSAVIWPTEYQGAYINTQDTKRFLTLSDGGKSGFWGEITNINGYDDVDNVKIFTSNLDDATSVYIETIVKVFNIHGGVSERFESAYSSQVISNSKKNGYFELGANSFTGLDFTDASKIQVTVYRVPQAPDGCAKGGIDITGMFICMEDNANLGNMPGTGFKYSSNGSQIVWDIYHQLNSIDLITEIYDTNNTVIPSSDVVSIENLTANHTKITFTEAKEGFIVFTGGKFSGPTVEQEIRTEGIYHPQPTSKLEWTITHNIGSEFLFVHTYNQYGEQVIPQTIKAVDANTTKIIFDEPTKGSAVIAGGFYNVGLIGPEGRHITAITSNVDAVNETFDLVYEFSTGPDITVTIDYFKGDRGIGITDITLDDNLDGSYDIVFSMTEGPDEVVTTPNLRGQDGTSQYLYISYATNSSGAGSSATPNQSLQWRAELVTNSATRPAASAFNGLYLKYIGEDGQGSGDMLAVNNLSDLSNYATARNNLDVYDKATVDNKVDARILISNIQDVLISTDTTKPLSASQGKILNDRLVSLETLVNSDDTTLDTIQEIVDFISINKSTLDALSIASIAGLQVALDGKEPTKGEDDNYVTDAEKTVIGNTSGTNTGDQTSVTGNAGTATILATARTINGVAFNGSSDITVPSNITPGTSGNVLTSNGSVWTSAEASGGDTPEVLSYKLPAGETISASKAVSRGTGGNIGKLYHNNSNILGVSINGGSANDDIDVAISGIVGGFTGLTSLEGPGSSQVNEEFGFNQTGQAGTTIEQTVSLTQKSQLNSFSVRSGTSTTFFGTSYLQVINGSGTVIATSATINNNTITATGHTAYVFSSPATLSQSTTYTLKIISNTTLTLVKTNNNSYPYGQIVGQSASHDLWFKMTRTPIVTGVLGTRLYAQSNGDINMLNSGKGIGTIHSETEVLVELLLPVTKGRSNLENNVTYTASKDGVVEVTGTFTGAAYIFGYVNGVQTKESSMDAYGITTHTLSFQVIAGETYKYLVSNITVIKAEFIS